MLFQEKLQLHRFAEMLFPSQSHACVHLYSLVTQKGSVTQKFLSFPPWDLFSGPYWKHYQRKLGASDPSLLCFTVCFLLCLWFSLDLPQLWFILVSCSGICWVSLCILCILLCYYFALLWIVIFRWHSAFVLLLSTSFPDLGQRWIPGWLSTSCLTREFLLPFLSCWKIVGKLF